MSNWGESMSDRVNLALGQLGELFDGPHATPKRTDTGPYFLNISSLVDGRLDLSRSDHVSEKEFARWTRRVTPLEGDLLFSYETRLGDAALMPSDLRACLGRRMAILRPDRNVIDPAFLLYFYISPEFKALIEKHTIHGATVNRIGLSTMGKWLVSIPALPEQRAIAEVLGALDDNIAANTKLALIADEWVRARFDALSREAIETRPVAELVSLRRDQVRPASFAGDVLYVGLEHVPRRSMWLGEVGSSADVTSHKSRFEPGDILFGKLRPYFHKVVTSPHRGVCSTDILVLTPKDPKLAGIVLAAVASDSVVRDVTSASEGTRMPRTNWKDLASVEVPWPGSVEALTFSADVSAVRDGVESQLKENRFLAATRDALLPQLMSGKLRVKDAEKVLESVL